MSPKVTNCHVRTRHDWKFRSLVQYGGGMGDGIAGIYLKSRLNRNVQRREVTLRPINNIGWYKIRWKISSLMGCQLMSTVNDEESTSRIFINTIVRAWSLAYVYFGEDWQQHAMILLWGVKIAHLWYWQRSSPLTAGAGGVQSQFWTSWSIRGRSYYYITFLHRFSWHNKR
jgi:hypothetical protein